MSSEHDEEDSVPDLIEALNNHTFLQESETALTLDDDDDDDDVDHDDDNKEDDDVHPCYRKRADAGAVFSSSCCPSRPGLSESCEIPFGVILTPLASEVSKYPNLVEIEHSKQEQSFMCIHCLCYLNMYAHIDTTNRAWECPLCQQLNAIPSSYNLEESHIRHVKTLTSPIVEYRRVLPGGAGARSGAKTSIGAGIGANTGGKKSSPCYVFVIDANLPTDQMQSIRDNIVYLLDHQIMESDALIGLVVYSANVSVYQVGLGFTGICSADIYPCHKGSPQSKSTANTNDTSEPNSSSNHNNQHQHITHHITNARSYLAPINDTHTHHPSSGGDSSSIKSTILQIMKAIIGETSKDPSLADGIHNRDNMNASGATSVTATANGGSRNKNMNGNHPNNHNHDNNPKLSRREMLRLRREERLNAEKHKTIANSSTTTTTSTTRDSAISTSTSTLVSPIFRNQLQPPPPPPSPFPSSFKPSYSGQKYQHRCTGTAMRMAIDLATSSPRHTGRILLFTNGCPNLGVGSVVSPHLSYSNSNGRKMSLSLGLGLGGKGNHYNRRNNRGTKRLKRRRDVVDPNMMGASIDYFKYLGEDAYEGGIGIDVFCSGTTALGIPALQSLVAPSSGYALPHASFSDEQFRHNLRHLLKHTRISKSLCEGPGLDGCILDLRMPSYIEATQAIGPGEGIQDDDQGGVLPCEGPIFSSCAALAASQGMSTHNLPSQDLLKSTLSRIRLGRYDPLSTFSVLLQVNEDCFAIGEKHAFFQFIVRYMERDGVTLVTRVTTHRLAIGRTVHDFLDGIDEEVVPVLLGREAILRSLFRRDRTIQAHTMDKDQEELLAQEAKRDLDATVHRISKAYRLLSMEADISSILTNSEPSSQPSLDFAFPPELVDALHMLHHLRRGLLLDPSLHSAEDRAVLRDLFLRLPMEDSLFMMAPSLLSIRVDFIVPSAPGMEAFEHVPPETLVLWDNVVIAGDHFDSLFVWSGRALPKSDSRFQPVRDQCKSFLKDRAKHRFPAPSLHILSESDSMGRRFTSRLVPSHLDPPEQQVAHFPALATLSEDEIYRLRDKFRFYDESHDASFRRWFWTTASVSSKASEEGISLCE